MLNSYLKLVLRNFLKNRIFSLINVAGLALGISSFTMILLFVEKEFSYDKFHRNPENVYRIVKDFVNNGARIPDATTPPGLTNALRDELPEIENITRFFPNGGRRNLLEYGDKRFYELNMLRVDTSFFHVFDFQFVKGSKEHPFQGVHSILLTETTARKYFGNENPLGKIIHTNINNNTDFLVSGILRDVPENSHFSFDILIPFESGRDANRDWNWYGFYTYARLKPNTDPKLFESNVQNIFKKYQPNSTNEFYIQPLTDIHLKSRLKLELGENGDITYVRILLVIGIFVLVIAAINYVNLVTVQSAKRAKEVGIRKVTGAFRHLLIRQFLLESILMVLIAAGLSIILTTLLLPLSKPLLGNDLSVFVAESHFIRTVLPACVLLVGLLAGLYPALYLSSFQPIKVLRGSFFSSVQGVSLRQGLVIFQFVISSMLIVGFLVIRQQIDYISNKNLGFDPENIVMVPNVVGMGNPEALAADFKKIHSVRSVARASGGILGFRNATNGVASKNRNNHITLNFIRADYDFIPTLNIELLAGRNFSDQFPSDSNAIVINEEAVAQLGLQSPVVGQQLEWDDQIGKAHDVTIVGVAKDFHFTSFHDEIKPFGFILEVNNGSTFFLKVQSQNISETLEDIKRSWTKHNPDRPFDYSFQDEQMTKLHLSEERFKALFSGFTVLAIVIACLGLLGLVNALADSKTKEIGIRKILGSSVTGIIALLSKEFIKLVSIALIIAMPMAFFAANYWLEGFAYRISIGWEVFVLAGCATFIITVITISTKSVKTALSNPADSLRNE